MTHITLPCCESSKLVDDLDAPIHCDDCGIDLELARDAAEPVVALAA